jgi:hypothetical protein
MVSPDGGPRTCRRGAPGIAGIDDADLQNAALRIDCGFRKLLMRLRRAFNR